MHINNMTLIGVDMGGSNIRAGLIVNGKIEAIQANKLPEGKEYNAVMQTVFATIDAVFTPDVIGIGIGFPSVVERKRGIVYNAQNIPSWIEVPLKEIIEKKYGCLTLVNNDANCFALGERIFGKGQKFENFVGLAIGTGVGGGIINRGKLLLDVNCGAGEFGEMSYLDARYEDYCSGVFFDKKHSTTGEALFSKAAAGDPSAMKIASEFGYHLGKLVQTVMLAVDPEAIIIGGSIAKAAQYYEKAMWESIKTFSYPKSVEKLVIEFTDNSQIQILGSAALYIDAL